MAEYPNEFPGQPADGPAESYFAITPSDSVNFTFIVRAIYVGSAGNVACVNTDGTAVTFSNVPQGVFIPAKSIRVNATNTTAGNLVGMY